MCERSEIWNGERIKSEEGEDDECYSIEGPRQDYQDLEELGHFGDSLVPTV